MRRCAWVLLVVFVASCARSPEVVERTSAAVARGSVSSTSSAPSPSSTVAPSTTTPVAPPSPTTSATLLGRRIDVAPGDALELDERLGGDAFGAMRDPSVQADAWLVGMDDVRGVTQRSALLGRATVSRDGHVQLRTAVPTLLARRTTKFGPAVPERMTRGSYVIEVMGRALVSLVVTRDGPSLELPVGTPAQIEVARQLLGDDHLAGIGFGTRDEDAEQLLLARFGPPDRRREWTTACLGEQRWMSWGPLLVGFTRDHADADGRLSSYRYGLRDWFYGPMGIAAPEVADLGTATNIAIGTTIAELRGVSERGEVRTGYDDFDGRRWHDPGRGIVAVLDRDFLAPDATVVAIVAPPVVELTVC